MRVVSHEGGGSRCCTDPDPRVFNQNLAYLQTAVSMVKEGSKDNANGMASAPNFFQGPATVAAVQAHISLSLTQEMGSAKVARHSRRCLLTLLLKKHPQVERGSFHALRADSHGEVVSNSSFRVEHCKA